jgi:hypothetical protein
MTSRTRRWLLIALAGLGGLSLALVVVVLSLYWASQQAPEFYQESLKAEPARQAKASDEMLQQTTALVSDVKKEGQWHTLFTADQINGWLAVDLPRNHPGAMPSVIRDPRVQIKPDQLNVACRYEGSVKSVLWLSLDVYLAEPNVMALRIKKARAGLLPLPLNEVLGAVSLAAERLNLHIEWKQSDGDPVALVRLPPQRDGEKKRIRIESLRLGDNELYLGGSTEPAK